MLPIAARSPEPAKRCERPQSFSASAAGLRRRWMSSSTSMAAASLPPRRIVRSCAGCPNGGLSNDRRPRWQAAANGSGLDDDHLGTDAGALVEVDHVVIEHAHAAAGNRAADRLGLIGAVDAEHGVAAAAIEIERAGAERVVQA